MVLPDGSLVTASDSEYSDLFWAAKGSGPGFFGIVVRLRLKTLPRPMAMHHVTYILPAKENYEDVFKWLQTCW